MYKSSVVANCLYLFGCEMLKKSKILLVEDNAEDVKLMKIVLQRHFQNIDLLVIQDGKEALQFFNSDISTSIDLIFLDLNLPGINGIKILKKIKSNSFYKVIPTIMLTTSKAKEDVQKCLELGANAYVQKPLKFTELKKIMQKLINFWFDPSTLQLNKLNS